MQDSKYSHAYGQTCVYSALIHLNAVFPTGIAPNGVNGFFEDRPAKRMAWEKKNARGKRGRPKAWLSIVYS
ncbi:MAG: hypothetical protein ACKV2V_10060 [Blastocatellia bacterium]